jgi:hypothetical protein
MADLASRPFHINQEKTRGQCLGFFLGSAAGFSTPTKGDNSEVLDEPERIWVSYRTFD